MPSTCHLPETPGLQKKYPIAKRKCEVVAGVVVTLLQGSSSVPSDAELCMISNYCPLTWSLSEAAQHVND